MWLRTLTLWAWMDPIYDPWVLWKKQSPWSQRVKADRSRANDQHRDDQLFF